MVYVWFTAYAIDYRFFRNFNALYCGTGRKID